MPEADCTSNRTMRANNMAAVFMSIRALREKSRPIVLQTSYDYFASRTFPQIPILTLGFIAMGPFSLSHAK